MLGMPSCGLVVLLAVALASAGAVGLEEDGFQHLILTWPALLEEESCAGIGRGGFKPSANETVLTSGKETDPYDGDINRLHAESPLDGHRSSMPINCPKKPWEHMRSPKLTKEMWVGPDIIYTAKLDDDVKKQLSMSILASLKSDLDSTCMCYHDSSAPAEENGLKCLCRAKGMGKMLNAAMPEYLVQKAIALGEYPKEFAHPDAALYLNEYRRELQTMSDMMPKGVNAKTGRPTPSFEQYLHADAEFLKKAASGSLRDSGELRGMIDYTEHPEANCTSKHMTEQPNFVPVETFKDQLATLTTAIQSKRGMFSDARQSAIRSEVIGYYQDQWASGKVADTSDVSKWMKPMAKDDIDSLNDAMRESFGKRVGPDPGAPEVGGPTHAGMWHYRQEVEKAIKTGNSTLIAVAKALLAVNEAVIEVTDAKSQLSLAETATTGKPSTAVAAVRAAKAKWMDSGPKLRHAIAHVQKAQEVVVKDFQHEYTMNEKAMKDHGAKSASNSKEAKDSKEDEAIRVKLMRQKVLIVEALIASNKARTTLRKELDSGNASSVALAATAVTLAETSVNRTFQNQINTAMNITHDLKRKAALSEIDMQLKTDALVTSINTVDTAKKEAHVLLFSFDTSIKNGIDSTEKDIELALKASVPKAVEIGRARLAYIKDMAASVKAMVAVEEAYTVPDQSEKPSKRRSLLEASSAFENMAALKEASAKADLACKESNRVLLALLAALGSQPGVDVAQWALKHDVEIWVAALDTAVKVEMSAGKHLEADQFANQLILADNDLALAELGLELAQAVKAGDMKQVHVLNKKKHMMREQAVVMAAKFKMQIATKLGIESEMKDAVQKFNASLAEAAIAMSEYVHELKVSGADKKLIETYSNQLAAIHANQMGLSVSEAKKLHKKELIVAPLQPQPFAGLGTTGHLHKNMDFVKYGGGNTAGGADMGDCCEMSHTGGCSAKAIETCVCKQDNFCCEGRWDITCIRLIKSAKCSYRKGPCPKILGTPDDDASDKDDGAKPKDDASKESAAKSSAKPTVWCRDYVNNHRVPCDFIFNRMKRDANDILNLAKIETNKKLKKDLEALSTSTGSPVAELAEVAGAPWPIPKVYVAPRHNGRSYAKFKSLHQNKTSVNHVDETLIPPPIKIAKTKSQYVGQYDFEMKEASDPVKGIPGVPVAQKEGCCYAHDSPGCVDSHMQDCVCAQDDSCCSGSWDEHCVLELDKHNCGKCTVADRKNPNLNVTTAAKPEPEAPSDDVADNDHPEPEADNHTVVAKPAGPSKSELRANAAKLAAQVKKAAKKFGTSHGQNGGHVRPADNVAEIKPLVADGTPAERKRLQLVALGAAKKTNGSATR